MRTFGSFRKLLLAAVCGLAFAAEAQAEDFYAGKTIRIICNNPVAGSTDLYSRLVAKHMGKYIPGNPSFVVENQVGAGGIIAANQIYTQYEGNSLIMGSMNSGFAFEPLLGANEAKYDPTKYNWIASPAAPTAMLTLWHQVPVYSLDDARKREIVLGGGGGTTAIYSSLLRSLFDLKLKFISGYSNPVAFLAMERGELDGYPNGFWSTMRANYPSWLAEKKLRFLVQFGAVNPDVPKDIPFATELLKDQPEKKQLLDLGVGPLEMGFPFIMPPGVPAENVAIIRKALLQTFADPEFRAEAKKTGLDVDEKPTMTGDYLQGVLAKSYGANPAVKEQFLAIYSSSRTPAK